MMNIIETGRFIVREWNQDDAIQLVKAREDRQIAEGLHRPDKYPYTIEAAIKDISLARKNNSSETSFAITIDNVIAGEIGCGWDNERRGVARIFYWISPEHRNKGVMTEVVKLFTEYAFKRYNLREMNAGVLTDNTASSKVLMNAGYKFKQEARHLDWSVGIPFEILEYSMINYDRAREK